MQMKSGQTHDFSEYIVAFFSFELRCVRLFI